MTDRADDEPGSLDAGKIGQLNSSAWWATNLKDLQASLRSGYEGLSSRDADARSAAVGKNVINPRREVTVWSVLLRQFRSPLVLILVFASVVSGMVAEWLDASIILAIVVGSALLGFFQEFRASNAVAELQARVELRARVRRDGGVKSIPASDIVPGDVVIVSTGGLVPADGRVLGSTDCYVSEAILTGETYPVAKQPGVVDVDSVVSKRVNCLWMGTTVRTGTAEMLVIATGPATQYGLVAQHLALRPPETSFELGIRRFGHLLTQVMVVLVVLVFAANVFLNKPAIESLLFAIALAVGIAPELLPAIMAINLSHGARRMAEKGVIVRHLGAIQNLGSMQILCTDKTGTLTEGAMTLDSGRGPDGSVDARPVELALVNAALQAGLVGPLDEALLAGRSVGDWSKVAEIPFDFFRKRLSVIARDTEGSVWLICKGALESVLQSCESIAGEHPTSLSPSLREGLTTRFEDWSRQGWRVVGVATKSVSDDRDHFDIADEEGMTFAGYLLFADPPKADARMAIADLNRLGVDVKVISGDAAEVTAHLAGEVGLSAERILTGAQMNLMSDEALWRAAADTDLFVEVDPTHKERIVAALRHGGDVVGFMGDGVNDAPALHTSDVGISVDTAVDVAREAASFVLLEHDLAAVREGIVEGRRTFANTIKYITTTESANFGNMISMAASSFFLPFLPLTATQVLLNNFLSDFPATTIATDSVDPEMVAAPERWDIAKIRNFMLIFGAVSSLFDFLTFGLLLWVFSASAELFRTGWFVESLLTELVIALVVRTRRLFYRSRPGRLLMLSTALVTAVTFLLPYLPFASALGFVTPTPLLMVSLAGVTALYVLGTEAAKQILYRSTRPGDTSQDRRH